MRREFIDETSIAVDVQMANDAIGRVLDAWMDAITQPERDNVNELCEAGMRLGMVVLLGGADEPARAEIVGVRENGEVLGLAELTYTPRTVQ